jgi:hypothetical protein
MTTTTTVVETLKNVLNEANPNKIADALAKIDLGTMFTATEFDTGAITGVAGVTIPGNGALLVQSARVVTSAVPASVGTYLAGDSAVTPLLPPGGAGVAIGIATLSLDGKTITFPNTVTRAIIRYIPNPVVALTDKFVGA